MAKKRTKLFRFFGGDPSSDNGNFEMIVRATSSGQAYEIVKKFIKPRQEWLLSRGKKRILPILDITWEEPKGCCVVFSNVEMC